MYIAYRTIVLVSIYFLKLARICIITVVKESGGRYHLSDFMSQQNTHTQIIRKGQYENAIVAPAWFNQHWPPDWLRQ